ncbi:inositol phosphatase [Pararhizobium polonicum]|uniref:Inositol-1-monophosphatase n=1 Tax=Pararhizobium polonicum TaxID=1612624 RepID=A0A1C7NWN1_9HYPH|nr:inositol monophosphatase [Pararhizobium polonicum]OBZ93421.1 inositol phosphatase [Pararhizobium polonicum]
MPAGRAYSDDIDGREALCRDVILSAGALALEGFQHGSAAAFSMKGPQDFLTETDAASEAHIRDRIKAAFPKDGFFGEESGGQILDNVWVVDPIDGTANFARGIPHFCISIGYLENGVPQLAAIYNPPLDELYFARAGQGATCNGRPISAARTSRFDAASIELGWSTRIPNEAYVDAMRNLLAKGANVRRSGSGAMALAYVADGRSDAYVELHMNSWDCIAGLLLVAEAGGRVCPFLEIGSLQEGGAVLASAPAIAGGVSEAVRIPLAEQPGARASTEAA